MADGAQSTGVRLSFFEQKRLEGLCDGRQLLVRPMDDVPLSNHRKTNDIKYRKHPRLQFQLDRV